MRARHRLSRHQRSVIESHARSMRHAPSRSEELLWRRALSGRQLGVHFRRQYRIGRFVADFAAPAVRLIVEVDGLWHGRRVAADVRRDRALKCAGWRVLRLPAELVERELSVAVERIRAALSEAPPAVDSLE
jgi:very-short-patch-repair endonuclease